MHHPAGQTPMKWPNPGDGRTPAASMGSTAAPSAAGAASRSGTGDKPAAEAGLITAGRLASWNMTTSSAADVVATTGAGDAHAAIVAVVSMKVSPRLRCLERTGRQSALRVFHRPAASEADLIIGYAKNKDCVCNFCLMDLRSEIVRGNAVTGSSVNRYALLSQSKLTCSHFTNAAAAPLGDNATTQWAYSQAQATGRRHLSKSALLVPPAWLLPRLCSRRTTSWQR